MPQNKITIGLNAFLLSIFGFIATKANSHFTHSHFTDSRFVHPNTGYFVTTQGGLRAIVKGLTSGFDTVKGTKSNVEMITTRGGYLGRLYTWFSPLSHAIYH